LLKKTLTKVRQTIIDYFAIHSFNNLLILRVCLTFIFLFDLRRIYYYGVSKFGINQPDNYFNMFYDCFERIEGNPYLFPSADHIKRGYRYCVCGVDTIYYQINEKTDRDYYHYWKARLLVAINFSIENNLFHI
jgi:toxin ParE1/3/4